jgi:hypothetical protein
MGRFVRYHSVTVTSNEYPSVVAERARVAAPVISYTTF